MLSVVSYADTVVVEARRQERIDRTLRDRAITMARTASVGSERLSLTERRYALRAVADLSSIPRVAVIESVDPLAVCPWWYHRPPPSWPEWRTLLDWAA